MHTELRCAACNQAHATNEIQNLCRSCGKPLLATYPLSTLKTHFTPEAVRKRTTRSLWRFHEVLPVNNPDEAVSLGEGMTPFLQVKGHGTLENFSSLFVKDESFNPTGSFKARGMTTAITSAKRFGVKTVALPSAGNAGSAAAAYAARAGMKCVVFVPEDTPSVNVIETRVTGADVVLVKGLINDCGKISRRGCDRFGWFDLSTMKEPFRVEGKKTMGYELAFDLADHRKVTKLQLPDVILYPTGGGTGLIGMWKAFSEMEELGWIDSRRPRMVAVQAAGCAPVVNAFEKGEPQAEAVQGAHTVASGLRVPSAIADFLMLKALRDSQGTAIAVSDDELTRATEQMSRALGGFVCPEAGAVWAAGQKLAEKGWLKKNETIVFFNTGTGMKYTHLFPIKDLPVIQPEDADKFLDQFEN